MIASVTNAGEEAIAIQRLNVMVRTKCLVDDDTTSILPSVSLSIPLSVCRGMFSLETESESEAHRNRKDRKISFSLACAYDFHL